MSEDDDGYEHHVAGSTNPAIVSTTPPTGSATPPVVGTPSSTGNTAPSAPPVNTTPATGTTTLPSHTEIQGGEHHHNFLKGGALNVTIHAGSMGDIVVGGSGNNTITGGAGDDLILAGASATGGTNLVDGGGGNNILVAAGTKTQQLDDFIHAHQSTVNSVLSNGKLADLSTIINGAVNNTGGGVKNVFQMHSGIAHDQIYNFHAASDKLQIQAGINGSNIKDIASLISHVTISGNNVTVDLGIGSTVTLVGVDFSHLSAANVAIV